MAVVKRSLDVKAKGDNDIVDLTDLIGRELDQCELSSGPVTVFVKHATAAVTVIELEPGLIHDYQRFWNQMVPRDIPYEHHLGSLEENGHAHVRASTRGPSLVIPFSDQRMTLGT